MEAGEYGLQVDRVAVVVGQRRLQQLGGHRDVLPAVVDRLCGDVAKSVHPPLRRRAVAGGGTGQAVAVPGQGEHQGAQVEQVPGEVSGAAFQSAELLQRPLRVDRFHGQPGAPGPLGAVLVGPDGEGEPAVHVGPGGGGLHGQPGQVEWRVEHHDQRRVTPVVVRIADAVQPAVDELPAGEQGQLPVRLHPEVAQVHVGLAAGDVVPQPGGYARVALGQVVGVEQAFRHGGDGGAVEPAVPERPEQQPLGTVGAGLGVQDERVPDRWRRAATARFGVSLVGGPGPHGDRQEARQLAHDGSRWPAASIWVRVSASSRIPVSNHSRASSTRGSSSNDGSPQLSSAWMVRRPMAR